MADYGQEYGLPTLSQAQANAIASDPDAPVWRSAAGVDWNLTDHNDGNWCISAVQDVYQILELNKAMFTENSGWNWDKSMRRCASIPHGLRLKWLVEEGWDAWNPEHEDALKKKLNDPDYRHLRTAPGRV